MKLRCAYYSLIWGVYCKGTDQSDGVVGIEIFQKKFGTFGGVCTVPLWLFVPQLLYCGVGSFFWVLDHAIPAQWALWVFEIESNRRIKIYFVDFRLFCVILKKVLVREFRQMFVRNNSSMSSPGWWSLFPAIIHNRFGFVVFILLNVERKIKYQLQFLESGIFPIFLQFSYCKEIIFDGFTDCFQGKFALYSKIPYVISTIFEKFEYSAGITVLLNTVYFVSRIIQ